MDAATSVIALGVGPGATPAAVPDAALAHGVHGHRLRVALSMRGGVSLAVWIGGAVAECDVARRVRLCRTRDGWDGFYIPESARELPALDSPEIARARVYARLLDRAGCDAVEFDVLAGASAGGLNAVVYATAQRAGASVDALLGTWQEAADVRRLLHEPGFRTLDSLMRGDGYFWPRLVRALHDLYDDAVTPRHPAHRAESTSVDLAATMIDSAVRSEPSARDSRAYFHFVGSDDDADGEHGRRIPDDPGDGTDLARLAYAARSTSSFPGAFEPALVFSTTKAADEPVAGDATHVDMSFAFSRHREGWNRPFRIIDGSILDEVPIDQAFRAVRQAASGVSSSRVLLYLDPKPPQPPPRSARSTRYGPADAAGPLRVMARWRDRQSQLLTVVRAGRQTLEMRSSGDDEVAQVERFRLALLGGEGRDAAYAAIDDAAYDAAALRRGYVRYRAAADARFLTSVAADPAQWQLTTNLRGRRDRKPWNARDRGRIAPSASRRYRPNAAGLDAAVAFGPQAVVDAARGALAWVHALEAAELSVRGDAAIASLRLELYRVLTEATDARDEAAAFALDSAMSGEERSADLVDAWLAANREHEPAALWERLDGGVHELRRQSIPADGDPWRRSPFSGPPTRDERFTARDLAPFLSPRGIPEPVSSLSFARITGDERPAHPEQFTALVARRQQAMARVALGLPSRDIDDETVVLLFGAPRLTAEDKLAGSQLGNFGGFLSTAWRSNDWWWGRMDAAAGLVRMLDGDARRSAPVDGRDIAESERHVDEAQSTILEQLAHSPRPPLRDGDESDPRSVRSRMEIGADGIANLAPTYRLALASRLLRVAARALDGSLGTAGRIGTLALRTVAVIAPLVLTPLRGAAFGAIVGLAVAISSTAQHVPRLTAVETLPAFVILTLIASGIVAGFAQSQVRWGNLLRHTRRVADRLPELSGPALARLRRQALVYGGVLSGGALGATMTAGVLACVAGVSAAWWIVSASAVALGIVGRRWSLEPPPGALRPGAFLVGAAAYAAWVAAVIGLPTLLAPLRLDHRWLTPTVTVVAALTAALLLTVGWLRPRATPRGVLVNAYTVSAAAAVVGGIPVWIATQWRDAPFPALTVVFALLATVLLWGSAVWWLPEFRAADGDFPDDERRPSAV